MLKSKRKRVELLDPGLRWDDGQPKILTAGVKTVVAICLISICLSTVTGLAGVANAQDHENSTFEEFPFKKRPPEKITMDPSQPPKRDPFAVTRKLVSRDEGVRSGSSPSYTDLVFAPQRQPEKLPKMRLRGHLQGSNNESVALLEIQGGGVYIVREGDTVGLHEFGLDSVIQIREISRLHMLIESGALETMIIVR